MSDEHEPPTIKVTDRRHFDKSGEKRPGDDSSEVSADSPLEPAPAPTPSSKQSPAPTASAKGTSRESPPGRRPAGSGGPQPSDLAGSGTGPRISSLEGSGGGPAPRDHGGSPSAEPGQIAGDLSDVAIGLSSSFSLLIARLAQETEIYLGLVPYPGKETAEPDLEAARAMIDVLSMLQEKTRGNLDEQEAHLLENLLYTYRLEFVRRRSGGDIR